MAVKKIITNIAVNNLKNHKMKKFLSMNHTDGKFFESSKEEIPGYVKHTTKDGKVYYRNFYLKGITGTFKGMEIDTSGNFGDQLKIGLESEGTMYILCMNTKTNSGFYDDNFFADFLKVAGALELGKVYTISPYRFTPKGDKYEKAGVRVSDENGEKIERVLSTAYYKNGKLVKGDVPAIKFKEKKAGGYEVDKKSLIERDEYLDVVIERLLEKFPANFSQPIQGTNVTSADLAAQRNQSDPVEEQKTAEEEEAPATTAKVEKEEAPKETKKVEADDLPF